MESCQTCKFQYSEGLGLFCRRHPPALCMTQQGPASMFPPVSPTQWCGDHESAAMLTPQNYPVTIHSTEKTMSF